MDDRVHQAYRRAELRKRGVDKELKRELAQIQCEDSQRLYLENLKKELARRKAGKPS